MRSNFPDQHFLENLVQHSKGKLEQSEGALEQLVMCAGATLNWIGDYMTDPHVQWTQARLTIDDITFTGTNPVWNEILIGECQRNPQLLRKLFEEKPAIKSLFDGATFVDVPVLVRYEEDKYKMLDGMHRLVGAIKEGKVEINAFVATIEGTPQPACEAHVVYDLLRPYQRKITQDRDGLVAALHYLRRCYGNVDDLLNNRFSKERLSDQGIQDIIQEVLMDG